MTDSAERRAQGVHRVPIATLVEICGRDVGGNAFEAESVEVSGRGMHLKTAFLPEIGEPLVCRFEQGGREVIVEGSVAWREDHGKGGEFGVKFTALDATSVAVLRDLCGVELADSESPGQPEASAGADRSQSAGSRVRLHIDGLGSPMKARVRVAGSKQVRVGSNLEFLKVGRHLEIEDLEAGARRGAQIDAVSVAIDPSSSVPQLVVSLRYDEPLESTPEPSVIDASGDDDMDGDPAGGAPPTLPGIGRDAAHGQESDDELMAEAEAMRGRLGMAASSAGKAVQRGGAAFAKAGVAAVSGMGRLFRGAADKIVEKKRGFKPEPRRTTAPAPSGMMSTEGRRLRPQSGAAAAAVPMVPTPALANKRVRRMAAIGIALTLAIGGGALAFKKPAEPPGAAAAEDAKKAVTATAAAADSMQVDETGEPVAPPAAKLAAAPEAEPAAAPPGAKPAAPQGAAPPGAGGIVADVPLFGPTPMATMEPAPLGAAPAANAAGDEATGDEPAPEEKKELAAANASMDEGFEDSPTNAGEKKTSAPQDVKPWGRGNVHTPTIHRIRLDGAGGALQGAINPTGFTVVIPGRKAMETGKSIAARDKRIAAVRTRNSSSGTQIAFQFKDGVPGYRVRLRKDMVEFLISAPDEKKAAAHEAAAAPAHEKAAPAHKKHHADHAAKGAKKKPLNAKKSK